MGAAPTLIANHKHIQKDCSCVNDLCRRPTPFINGFTPLGPDHLHPFPRQLVNLSYLFVCQPTFERHWRNTQAACVMPSHDLQAITESAGCEQVTVPDKVMKASLPHLQLPVRLCREEADAAHPLYKVQVGAVFCQRCLISLQKKCNSSLMHMQHMQLARCSSSQLSACLSNHKPQLSTL